MPLNLPPMRSVPQTVSQWDKLFQQADATPSNESVTTAKLADDSVTNAKLRNSAPLTIIGRAANTTGNPADIPFAADDEFLVRRAGEVTSDAIQDADIAVSMILQHALALQAFERPRVSIPRFDDAQTLLCAQVFS